MLHNSMGEIPSSKDSVKSLIAGREEKVEMSKLDNPEVKKAMKFVEEILSDPKEREILDARKIARFVKY